MKRFLPLLLIFAAGCGGEDRRQDLFESMVGNKPVYTIYGNSIREAQILSLSSDSLLLQEDQENYSSVAFSEVYTSRDDATEEVVRRIRDFNKGAK